MIDPFGRRIDYLRVSVTDRCNLRCVYCMPAEGLPLVSHDDILRYEEIAEVVREAADLGVTKVRLTGGEPLTRRNIESLIVLLARIDGVRDLAMTTNGTLLAPRAVTLKAAGLMRVNVSLDSVDPDRYAEITRGRCAARDDGTEAPDAGACSAAVRRSPGLKDVLAGIDAALAAGLTPVKLNCVIERSVDEPDARGVADYARRRGLEVRFIPRMDLATGRFGQVVGGDGGACGRCSRLRLTSDGYLRPCLMSDVGFSVRELGPREAISLAVKSKPEAGGVCEKHWIRRIGG
ncbi:MAG: Cyclic pyranopterin monophosphate synthase [Planctomycetes bacterium ADurb.Bin126]|nr:MAG: Cyclic pyranopterin monophosphate synthase [Planctomycetes bacterium ADurb.Bin126]HOD83207.1 radical SAM protein [Phycisphaerae bacterium]HQL73958.1 radical SAM protein [Phycisphaerae bacterium]